MATGEHTRYYPAFLDLRGRLVIVIGSGRPAEKKARQLARYGADVLIITPEPSVDILQAQVEGLLGVEGRDYVRGDLEGASLVFCLSADPETRRAVATEARQVGAPVNISGAPEITTFLAPSVVHREPFQVAISTGGLAPHLAKRLRGELAERFGEEWGAYVDLLAHVRAEAMARYDDPAAVDLTVEAVLDSDVIERLTRGEEPEAIALVEEFGPEVAESEVVDDEAPEPDATDDAADTADADAGADDPEEAS